MGVNISDVGAIVQMLTNGFKAGEYRPDDSRDEVEIRVRFKRDERSLTGIDDLKVPSSRGQIPISSFIKLFQKKIGNLLLEETVSFSMKLELLEQIKIS